MRTGSQSLTRVLNRVGPPSQVPTSRVASTPLNGSDLRSLRASPGRLIPAIHPADQNCSAAVPRRTGRLESSLKPIHSSERLQPLDRFVPPYFADREKVIGGKKCKREDCCASVSTRRFAQHARTDTLSKRAGPTPLRRAFWTSSRCWCPGRSLGVRRSGAQGPSASSEGSLSWYSPSVSARASPTWMTALALVASSVSAPLPSR